MKRIEYEIPTSISEIRRQWNGDFKPLFGRGTGAGEIKCPVCYCAMGKLLDVPAIKPGANLDLVTLRGHINTKHPDNGCCNAGLKVDLSNLQMRDLLVNVMPNQGWTYNEYVEQITGPGMVYNPDLGSRLSESSSDWVFDSSKYRNYLMRNARPLLHDIGSRYGTLKEGKNGTYEMTTFGGVTEIYEDAIHGCDSWYGYIMDVVKDDATAYDPAQVTLLKHIHKYLENEKVCRYEAMIGPNTNQWWIYDNEKDLYIDPPNTILKDVANICKLDEAEKYLNKLCNEQKPSWLYETEHWYKDIEI